MVDPAEKLEVVRADLWLWAVRIYKTRSQAALACRRGRVELLGSEIKASRLVRLGDELTVKKPLLTSIYRVKGLLEKRVGASVAKGFCEDLTPQEDIDAARQRAREARAAPMREAGTGRPTKKDRRELEARENLRG